MSLIEVKNQIQSTKNTKKITKAMQLVAASKMKRFQRMAVQTRQYAHGLVKALHLSHQHIAQTTYGQAHGDKHLFVLLTSDKGLCGAMNARLQRLLFRGELWNGLAPEKRALITIGRKSTEAARYAGIPVVQSFIRLNEEMTPLEAMEIIDDILEIWETGEYEAVHLVSPWYVNAFTFDTRMVTMLPLSEKQLLEFEHFAPSGAVTTLGDDAKDESAHFFEPTRERVAEALAEQITQSLFIESFYQLKATEYSSRMSAMKKATDAADDQIKLLTAKFNKARQAAITQQLAELASASEAMSTANSYENLE